MASSDTTTTSTARGYSATKDQLLKRLARIEGQVRGIERMVGDERYCIDVITQISAVQAALDKVALGLLDEHARHCVAGADGQEQIDKTDELMAAVGRLMRRAERWIRRCPGGRPRSLPAVCRVRARRRTAAPLVPPIRAPARPTGRQAPATGSTMATVPFIRERKSAAASRARRCSNTRPAVATGRCRSPARATPPAPAPRSCGRQA